MDKLDFNKPIIVELNGISAESEFDKISEDFMQKYPETEIENIEEANIKKIKDCSLTAFYEMEKILTDFEEKYPLTKIHQE